MGRSNLVLYCTVVSDKRAVYRKMFRKSQEVHRPFVTNVLNVYLFFFLVFKFTTVMFVVCSRRILNESGFLAIAVRLFYALLPLLN